MRTILIAVALTMTAAVGAMAPASVATHQPHHFYLHDATYNVTAEGTSAAIEANGVANCQVDSKITIGRGLVSQYNFQAILTLGVGCAPSLTIENVTGRVLNGGFSLFVRNEQLDVVKLPMTWSQEYMEWEAWAELSPPVYGTYREGGVDDLGTGWRELGKSGGWLDPGCSSCIYVHSWYWGHWDYPRGQFFSPLCSNVCDHYQEAHTEAWFQYPSGWCRTYGEVPWGSSQRCSVQ